MPFTCKCIDIKQYRAEGRQPEIGDIWEEPYLAELDRERPYLNILSPEYHRDWHHIRPPLVVRLPGDCNFCMDRCYSGKKEGWKVVGTAPRISIYPSICAKPFYHGHIHDGIIADDVDGRTYEKPLLASGKREKNT